MGTVTRWMWPECGRSEESGVRTGLGALTVGQPSPAFFSIHDDGQFLLLIHDNTVLSVLADKYLGK